MKKYLIFLGLFVSVAVMQAQETYGPKAGDISLSLQLGKAEDFDDLQYLEVNQDSYTIYVPGNSTVSTSDNSLINMIGVEGKFFLSDRNAIRLDFMGVMSATPAQDEVDGISYSYDDESTTVIPSYTSVPSSGVYKFVGSLGFDHYFSVRNKRLWPYLGAQFNGKYGRRQDYEAEDDLSERISEVIGLGGSVVTGVDYYVGPGMFLGLEVKACSYMYSISRIYPVAGVEAGQAFNHTLGFFSNPMLKIGFTF